MEKRIKTIAFYLPQFHTIPENDMAYGKGFTEWTNTKKAKPLFEGHLQPKTPLNENYYCLLDDGVMQSQAELAKKYGIYGFCYYHYWFNGKKLLEKPIEKMLDDKSIDIPFCLCWANENWTRKWDGGNNEVIVTQKYGDMKDLDEHIKYLCNFFNDDRYIKINDKPVFIIYRPDIIPDLKRVVKTFRKKVLEYGFPGIVLMAQYPRFYYENVSLDLFDNYIQFQPLFLQTYEINKDRKKISKKLMEISIFLGLRDFAKKIRSLFVKEKKHNELEIRSYDDDWQRILDYTVKDKRLIAGAFPDWDNTPRNRTGVAYKGSSPAKFEKYMNLLIDKVKREYSSDYIFINAWNEWAEGAVLEPSVDFQYGYLEALKKALN